MNMGGITMSKIPASEVLRTVQYCEIHCEHMSGMLFQVPDVYYRQNQISLLRDCADICALTVKFLARNSYFARMLAHLCAHICEACGQECSRFPDQMSQMCAQICFQCAQICRRFNTRGAHGAVGAPSKEEIYKHLWHL